ncbi:alpha/beta fold hydrolase [Pseudarthrobacter sp. NPDC058119]|uniref:alpha/beta fold hydrolase n=1 Tax=Pseudarthrobacter sp. NPDC058119 TaxID=3346348 RepID=UPI0036DAC832
MRTLTLPGADGVKISVQECGDPDAAPVVLLHALGDTAGDWETVAEALAPDFRVFAVDLRGHGGSDRPGEYSFELTLDTGHNVHAAAPAQFITTVTSWLLERAL